MGKRGKETQNTEQTIVTFEVCGEFPLVNTFPLTTKFHFLKMTIFAFHFMVDRSWRSSIAW